MTVSVKLLSSQKDLISCLEEKHTGLNREPM